jgi:hypothetical protein
MMIRYAIHCDALQRASSATTQRTVWYPGLIGSGPPQYVYGYDHASSNLTSITPSGDPDGYYVMVSALALERSLR